MEPQCNMRAGFWMLVLQPCGAKQVSADELATVTKHPYVLSTPSCFEVSPLA